MYIFMTIKHYFKFMLMYACVYCMCLILYVLYVLICHNNNKIEKYMYFKFFNNDMFC